MEIKQFDSSSIFKKVLKELSDSIYPNHSILNLQVHEKISENYHSGFALYNEEQLCACACLIENENLTFQNKKAISLAFYECVENDSFSMFFLTEISKFCKKIGFDYIIGPMNGSTWNYYRFTIDPKQDSFLTEVFHVAYYNQQWKKAGFKQIGSYLTHIDNEIIIPEKRHILDESIHFRNLDISNFEEEIKKIHAFCCDCFQNNFLYTPISETDFVNKYTEAKKVMQEELVFIAEHNNEVVGVLLALHDFYSINSKRLIVKTLARKSDRTYAGVAHELTRRILQTAKEKNYEVMLHAFMHEKNVSKNVSKKNTGKPFRKYELYCKEL
jgi:hypothetical protein